MKVSNIFKFTKTRAHNGSVGVGTAGESYSNDAWNTSWWEIAREHVRRYKDLEAIRYFPKEGDNIPTARAKLSPNLAYSGIWSVGKFEPTI